jgi:hypothetical protein
MAAHFPIVVRTVLCAALRKHPGLRILPMLSLCEDLLREVHQEPATPAQGTVRVMVS